MAYSGRIHTKCGGPVRPEDPREPKFWCTDCQRSVLTEDTLQETCDLCFREMEHGKCPDCDVGTNADGDTYRRWKSKVDDHIAAALGGLTSDDLPDWTYRWWFDNDRRPEQAATKAVQHALKGLM